MTVDLSFYDVPWYMEWTEGNDSDSCLRKTMVRVRHSLLHSPKQPHT